jgi:adenine-specific DNA methylase
VAAQESADGERKLCVRNPADLLQVMHGTAQCEHFVMEQTQRSITIRYTCPGHGHGRTTLAIETGKLVHVDTQGVLDGAPFSEDYEGRRIGNCS